MTFLATHRQAVLWSSACLTATGLVFLLIG